MISIKPPTIAILAGIDPPLKLAYSQVAPSLILPLPLLPLWKFRSDTNIVGLFANRPITIVATVFVAIILSLKVVFLYFIFSAAV